MGIFDNSLLDNNILDAVLKSKEKVSNIFGSNNVQPTNYKNLINPYLKRNGELVNPHMDYQKLLDSDAVSDKVKGYISEATGLSPTIKNVVSNVGNTVASGVKSYFANNTAYKPKSSSQTATSSDSSTTPTTIANGTGEFKDKVGQRITDTSKYNNGAAKGQCVWYALGRASERNGKTITISGNGNSMYYQAKKGTQLSASPENLKGNTLLCFNKGTSTAGQKYGHVIFIEDVVGDTVYYTEGGSGYYKNGTDGVVKTATKEQILKGVNSAGSRIGSEPLGLIDLSKY